MRVVFVAAGEEPWGGATAKALAIPMEEANTQEIIAKKLFIMLVNTLELKWTVNKLDNHKNLN